MPPLGAGLWRHFRVYQIFGANTDVGKTIFSTLLCRTAKTQNPTETVWYLKPVSTGASDDADVRHLDRFAQGTTTQNFYQFNEPLSPHLAARMTADLVPDVTLLQKITSKIRDNAAAGPGFMLVESAGGPNSPGPSGTLQADLYRPMRLPSIFVADWHLGGISTSISSFESLTTRGYDVEGVAVFKDSYYKNFEYFQSYFQDRDIPVLAIDPPPERAGDDDHMNMTTYYMGMDSGQGTSSDGVTHFATALQNRHFARVKRLESLANQAYSHIWWPFTQHKTLSPQSLTTIDSAYGDYFQTYKSNRSVNAAESKSDDYIPSILQSTVDGSASWWTQGVGHANPALTMTAAYAAGRYGHVMFAEAIHEPALSLAADLLRISGNPRLQRVFYSDNGSTGTEVAVKVALKAACVRYGWEKDSQEVEILGLQGSYHGDTMGAMDMSEPSVYNEKIPWYRGRGYWFECPGVKMRRGLWMVEKPSGLQEELGHATEFASLQDVFNASRDETTDAVRYEKYIRRTLKQLTQDGQRRFGALVMEPVVLGAGGMILVDPLFQRVLTKVVRSSASLFSQNIEVEESSYTSTTWTGLPVVADEVFTGLYRLGHKTSCSLLHIHPDVSVHAKLLTGGLLPLSTTLASESIFEAFLSDTKADALLHGHSYTAHPIGCAVAIKSLKILNSFDEGGNWDAFKADWTPMEPITSSLENKVTGGAAVAKESTPASRSSLKIHQIWSVWSLAFVTALSHATDRVDGVWALGSVLAISLRDDQGAGYTSNAAKGLQKQLLDGQEGGWNVHSRVLGNVLYLMTSQTSEEGDVRAWEGLVKEALGI